MLDIDYTETVIAKIIQINTPFYDNSHTVTPMGFFENGKFIFSTDIDSSGNTYVWDYDNKNMQKILSNYTFILKWGPFGTGKFIFPTDTTEMNSAENLYMIDFDMMEGRNLHHDKID
jgi:hypothetical protein